MWATDQAGEGADQAGATAGLVPYRLEDEDGGVVEVMITHSVAELLAAREPQRRERTFTDSQIRANDIPEGKGVRRGVAPEPLNPWEGGRYQFPILVGVGTVWGGPEGPDWCGGRELRPSECCLACHRTGRDKQIGKPTAADLRKRQEKKVEAKPAGKLTRRERRRREREAG